MGSSARNASCCRSCCGGGGGGGGGFGAGVGSEGVRVRETEGGVGALDDGGGEGGAGGGETRKRLLPAARTTRIILWEGGRVAGGVEMAAMVDASCRLGRGMAAR